MPRVLLTGMSGVGKSTLIEALASRGYYAIDTDGPQWCVEVEVASDDPYGGQATHEWIWHADRMQALFAEHGADDLLFVSGCVSNQSDFTAWFDAIILLTAPRELLMERLATRTSNDYGKAPEDVSDTLTFIETVEPLLRRSATCVVDTSAPVEAVVAAILQHVRRYVRGHVWQR